MAKILVVDDELDAQTLIRQKFRKKIKSDEYNFVFAVNGNDALEKLKEHTDVDVVLSDINMPEMDGLTLLTRLAEQHTLLKSVMVSAYGDMENIRIAMNRGAFDFVTKPVDFTDLELTIDKTIKHVAQLRRTMEALKENNIMKLYVDDTVLNFMGGQEFETSLTTNEMIDATVMFIDICKFTAISESAEPDDLINLLNTYFDVMVEEILAQDGYIDKFIGDAVMAVFRNDNHLERAAKSALAVRAKIDALPEEIQGIHFRPRVSIGLNSGEMISGNIGSPKLRRLDYTVLGDVVNISQRLQSAASPGQIYVNAATFSKLEGAVNGAPVGEIALKNKVVPELVYEILD